MIVDHINNWRRYGFGPAWEETMRWLENYAPGGSGSLADLTDGTHPLTDGFVSVATLTSRPLSGSLYECHKRFCDVQMVVEGQEWLFNAATTGLSLDGPFDDQRDVGFFQPAPAEVSRVTLSPGTFCPALPVGRASSGHRGGRSTGPLAQVRGQNSLRVAAPFIKLLATRTIFGQTCGLPGGRSGPS